MQTITKTEQTNEQLTVFIGQRIDSSNAQVFEQELNELRETTGATMLQLDASELEYVSSAGLRVLLKLRNLQGSLSILNVNINVYEVLDVSGFTSILNVQKALREISVEGCEIIGKGFHGTVYRLNPDTIVKLYEEGEDIAEVQREQDYSRKAFVYGVPTAIPFDVVRCGRKIGLVYEMINADTLANYVMAHQDQLESCAERHALLMQKLHSIAPTESNFSETKELYHGWTEAMSDSFTQEERDAIHRLLDQVPDKHVLIHADPHTKNIMIQDGELVLIDMADISLGHPVFDFAGIYGPLVYSAVMDTESPLRYTGIPYDLSTKYWDYFLSYYFPGSSEEELKQKNRIIYGFASLRSALLPAKSGAMTPEQKQIRIQDARVNFFPHVQEYAQLMDVLK